MQNCEEGQEVIHHSVLAETQHCLLALLFVLILTEQMPDNDSNKDHIIIFDLMLAGSSSWSMRAALHINHSHINNSSSSSSKLREALGEYWSCKEGRD